MAKKEQRCPFFSENSFSCMAICEGIFIPLPTHIKHYCKSAKHIHCQYWENGFVGDLSFGYRNPERRKYYRYTGNKRVTIAPAHRTFANGLKHLHGSAIDLSTGGMKTLTRQRLEIDATVFCSFDHQVPLDMRTGEARICWCTEAPDQLGFHTGLIFQDQKLPRAIGRFLTNGELQGLHH